MDPIGKKRMRFFILPGLFVLRFGIITHLFYSSLMSIYRKNDEALMEDPAARLYPSIYRYSSYLSFLFCYALEFYIGSNDGHDLLQPGNKELVSDCLLIALKYTFELSMSKMIPDTAKERERNLISKLETGVLSPTIELWCGVLVTWGFYSYLLAPQGIITSSLLYQNLAPIWPYYPHHYSLDDLIIREKIYSVLIVVDVLLVGLVAYRAMRCAREAGWSRSTDRLVNMVRAYAMDEAELRWWIDEVSKEPQRLQSRLPRGSGLNFDEEGTIESTGEERTNMRNNLVPEKKKDNAELLK
jgi:hypothetical protein